MYDLYFEHKLKNLVSIDAELASSDFAFIDRVDFDSSELLKEYWAQYNLANCRKLERYLNGGWEYLDILSLPEAKQLEPSTLYIDNNVYFLWAQGEQTNYLVWYLQDNNRTVNQSSNIAGIGENDWKYCSDLVRDGAFPLLN